MHYSVVCNKNLNQLEMPIKIKLAIQKHQD